MSIKENKTDESYFTCSLLSLLGFWVVLKPFWGFFLEERKKILERLQNHPETEKRRQQTSKV